MPVARQSKELWRRMMRSSDPIPALLRPLEDLVPSSLDASPQKVETMYRVCTVSRAKYSSSGLEVKMSSGWRSDIGCA